MAVPATTRRLACRSSLLAATIIVALLPASAPAAADSLPIFKLYIAAPGPYRVSFEELAAAGLDGAGMPSAGLGLFHDGHPAPVWVEDGGDGVFGPGDTLELLGKPPHGWVSHGDEHTRYNVYFVHFDAGDPLRMTAHRPDPAAPVEPPGHRSLRRDRHYESDYLIQSLPMPQSGRPDERWYWARLSHLDSEPFAHTLDLSDLDLRGGNTVDLRIELRGWSQPSHKPDPEVEDHRLEVLLNGYQVGTAEWNGTETYVLELTGLGAHWFLAGDNDLRLKIPRRAAGEAGEWLIDVVLLNWIEISYPRLLLVGGPPADFYFDPTATGPMRLLAEPGAEFVLFGRGGSRMTSSAVEPRADDRWDARTFHPAGGEVSFVTVSPDHYQSPAAIVRERPSRLKDSANRADYVMIAHRRLLAAIQPLAAFHRSRELEVEVVDVQDVYDEFSGGMARPWALRDFLDHAYHAWRKPAPRFVLLVGDASLNAKDMRIGDAAFPDHVAEAAAAAETGSASIDADDYTPYDQKTNLLNRHLIPTWNPVTAIGDFASDNHFVAVAGDDSLPDMAIGRLPVVEAAEVTAIVEKTISYVAAPEVGPWRRNVVFLTNTLKHFHRQSRWVAGLATAAGLKTHEIYPSLEEPDNERYTRQLAELLDEGQAFVHYLGHGGRYVWETGRRDLEENRDLFNLDHLEALKPTRRLPVVLSLTCFTAPFDHPHADSIGEKLLRLEDRGAIAVFASSQRSGPSGTWGQILLEELTAPGATVGEAVMRAKRTIKNTDFVDSYNLLGDPAVPVAVPAAEIALSVSGTDRGPLAIRGTLAVSAFSGELLIELTDANLEVLRRAASPLEDFEFTVDLEVSTEELADLRAVRAYAWDAGRGIDAAGTVEIGAPLSHPPRAERPFRKVTERLYPIDEAGSAASPGELLAAAVAWWSLDDASGAVIGDRSGAHPGSLAGRAGRSPSPHGGALAFYGRGFVDFGHDPELDLGTADFTVQAWIRTRHARREVWVILDKRDGAAGYHLYNYRGRLGLQLADGETADYRGPFVADGAWHHVAVSVDRDRSGGIRSGADAGAECRIRLRSDALS